MIYYKLSPGKFIEIDDNERARVFFRSDIVAQKADIQARLSAFVRPTNAELVDWAKLNHPAFIDTTAEEAELTRLNTLLDTIKEL